MKQTLAPPEFIRSIQSAISNSRPDCSDSESTAGVLVFGSRLGKLAYTEADLEFGAGLVAQAGVAFENSWYVRETIDRKKMEQELILAASIQEGLFPEFLPTIAGYEMAARNRPALQCGGDYYDVLPIDNGAPVCLWE